jgi:hypothetical protein
MTKKILQVRPSGQGVEGANSPMSGKAYRPPVQQSSGKKLPPIGQGLTPREQKHRLQHGKGDHRRSAARRRNVPDDYVYDPTVPRAPHQLNKHTGSRGNQAWHDQQKNKGFQMGDRDTGFQMGNVSNPFIMGGNRSRSSSSHLKRKDQRKRKKSDLPFEA